MSTQMIKKELHVIELLGQAWNEYLELDVINDWDKAEFIHAIHQAQNIVLAIPEKELLSNG